MSLIKAAKDIILRDFVSAEEEERRLRICRACPRFMHKTQQCEICYCVMPAKVKLTSSTCADLPPKW